jgi:hypothetical protein
LRKIAFFTAALVFFFALGWGVSAEEIESGPDLGYKPFLTFSYGAAVSWLTRIVNQTDRSNFVFRDFMPGLYFGMELRNIRYVTPLVRLTAYYPAGSTFNWMPQKPNTPLHIGTDFYAGLSFGMSIKEIVRLYAGPALHLLSLSSDRGNYFNMGASALAGAALPLTPGWTLLVDGAASLDNGNLGSNRAMEPFNTVFQYQIGLGCRYSKKMTNARTLFEKKDKDANESGRLNRTF